MLTGIGISDGQCAFAMVHPLGVARIERKNTGTTMDKAHDAFRTISEVAKELGVPKHVLRFWEGKFPQIKPMKRGGGRRYYRPEDLQLLSGIRALLHADGYTIKGVQKILREQGVETVKRAGSEVKTEKRNTGVSRQRRPTVRGSTKPVNGKGERSHSDHTIERASADGSRGVQVEAMIRELQSCRALLVDKKTKTARKHTTSRKQSSTAARSAS